MKSYKKAYRASANEIRDKRHVTDERRLKMCLDKMGYDGEFEATIEGAKRSLRPYKCNYCNHWHLTSLRAGK